MDASSAVFIFGRVTGPKTPMESGVITKISVESACKAKTRVVENDGCFESSILTGVLHRCLRTL